MLFNINKDRSTIPLAASPLKGRSRLFPHCCYVAIASAPTGATLPPSTSLMWSSARRLR